MCVWGGIEYVPEHRPCPMFVVVIFLIPTMEMLRGYLDQDATASSEIRAVSSSTSAVYSETMSVSQNTAH